MSIDMRKLQRALDMDGGKHSPADVADQIESGDAKLWSDGDSIIVTQIVDYPQVRVLSIWLAVGDMGRVRGLLPAIYEYGRENKCAHAETVCRLGWARVMADDGWKREDKVIVMTRGLYGNG